MAKVHVLKYLEPVNKVWDTDEFQDAFTVDITGDLETQMRIAESEGLSLRAVTHAIAPYEGKEGPSFTHYYTLFFE